MQYLMYLQMSLFRWKSHLYCGQTRIPNLHAKGK